LPVVFTMLSNHYSFTYSSPATSWLILACIFIASFLVRHWFNTMHAGQKPDWRLWPAAAVPVAVAIAFSVMGQRSPIADASAAPISFAAVQPIVADRCHMCHAAKPTFGGFVEAPKGVMFDTPAQIQKQAQQIMQQAVKTHAMPLGNITRITEEERATLGTWISQGAKL